MKQTEVLIIINRDISIHTYVQFLVKTFP